MDQERQHAQRRAKSGAHNSLLSKSAVLQTWFILAPILLGMIYFTGSTASRFRQVGDEIDVTTSSVRPHGLMPPIQVTVEPDPWNPMVALAPFAPLLWGVFAAAVGVMFLVALALAIMRILPTRRYKHVTGAAGGFAEPKHIFAKRQHLLRILENDVNALFEGRIEVRHVMTRAPLTISPTDSLETACELMDSRNVQHLVVCDDNGLLIGMLSLHFARRSNAKTVGKAMLTEPVTVAPDTLLNPTVTQMISTGVSCAAVAAEGYCVGILTTADVQLTLQCALALLFKATNVDTGEKSVSGSQSGPKEEANDLDCVLASVQPGEY